MRIEWWRASYRVFCTNRYRRWPIRLALRFAIECKYPPGNLPGLARSTGHQVPHNATGFDIQGYNSKCHPCAETWCEGRIGNSNRCLRDLQTNNGAYPNGEWT